MIDVMIRRLVLKQTRPELCVAVLRRFGVGPSAFGAYVRVLRCRISGVGKAYPVHINPHRAIETFSGVCDEDSGPLYLTCLHSCDGGFRDV